MDNGWVGFIVFAFSVIVSLLMVQLSDLNGRHRDGYVCDQELVGQVAKELVQSVTQSHPLLAYEHAIRAQEVLRGVLTRHGGAFVAGKNLRIEGDRLERLRQRVANQVVKIRDYLMEHVLEKEPTLNYEENVLAGITRDQTPQVLVSSDADQTPSIATQSEPPPSEIEQ